MTGERFDVVKLEVLRFLSEMGRQLLPERTMFVQLNFTVRPTVLRSELAEVLSSLESDKHVVGVRVSRSMVSWRITPEGEAELQALS